MRKATDRREKKKPTDRELGILLRDITGRMPRMPYNDREVRIAKTTYNGADRFVLTWRMKPIAGASSGITTGAMP